MPLSTPEMFSGWKKPYKEYDVGEQIGFGGTFGLWQIYSAVNRKSEQPVSIWLIEKKPIEKLWFKKDPTGFKKFQEYLKLEARALGNLNCGLIIYENMNDDGSYLSFCSEAVVGTVGSLYYQLGDFSIAKSQERQQTGTFSAQQQQLLKYLEPDMMVYGVSSLISDIAELHKNNVVHGNLAPSNIAITQAGEWRLCGFMFTQNQTFQFQFGNDSAHYLHPAAAFMSPRMIVGKYANFGTDCCQVFLSIFACAGNRAPLIDFGKESYKKDKWPTQDQLVSQVAEKVCGNALYTSQFHIEPSQAQKLASQNSSFWQSLCTNQTLMQQYIPLSMFGSIQHIILSSIQENQRGSDLQSSLNTGHMIGQISSAILQVNQTGGFSGKYGPENKYQFQQFFSAILNNYDSFSVEFIALTLLQRLVKLLQHRALHSDVMSLLIKLNNKLYIPKQQLFQLFEPIVISVTYSKTRQYYQNKMLPYTAWSNVQLQIFGDYTPNNNTYAPINIKYNSPYNDMQLEAKWREKDRDKFVPLFDKELNEQIPNSYHQIVSTICSNLNFFWHPQAYARSHFYTLNFIIGCFHSVSEIVLNQAINGLEASVGLLTDPRWMKEEGQPQTSAPLNTASATIPDKPDYHKPLPTIIGPQLTLILKTTKNPAQLEKIFGALAVVTPYFTDVQISSMLLPAVNNALDNVQQHGKAICGFAYFCRRTKDRCTGKTVAVMYLPRLLRMAYQDASVASQVIAACEELFDYVRADINGGNANHAIQQPQLTQLAQDVITETPDVQTVQNTYDTQQTVQNHTENDYQNQNYDYQYDYNYNYDVNAQQNYGYDYNTYNDYKQQYEQPPQDTGGDPMDW